MKKTKEYKLKILITIIIMSMVIMKPIVSICANIIDPSVMSTPLKFEMQNAKEENLNNISIKSASDGSTCYVRIKIFATSQDYYSVKNNSDWNYEEDGYWYYQNMLFPNETTTNLVIETNNQPIVVIAEATYVEYDENGNPLGTWDYIDEEH